MTRPARIASRSSLLGLLALGGAGCGAGTIDVGPDGGIRGEEPAPSPDSGSTADGGGCRLPAAFRDKEAFFTRGTPDGDWTIEDELVALIDGAQSGSQIRAAFAYLDQTRMADALIDASRRGASVKLIVDERNQIEQDGAWTWNSAVSRLRQELGDDLVICGGAELPADEEGGCIGRAKLHTAFLTVSSTCDGAELVVAQTSAYPTKTQLQQRNNLVVVRGDRGLFEAYRGYWSDLARQERDASYYRIIDGDAGTRLFLYPRAPGTSGGEPAATDTIQHALSDNVDCAAGARVKVAMAYWTSSRPALVDELVRLQAAGCAVDVVVDPTKIAGDVSGALVDAFAPDHLRFLVGVHHKLVIVEAATAGSGRRLLWTGTQDFTLAALRDNDETILRLEDDELHGDFVHAFDELFGAGTATPEAPP